MKYKVGDKVKVKKGLELNREYGGILFAKPMQCCLEVTIAWVHQEDEGYDFNGYSVKENNCFWTDEMLDGLVELEEKFNIIEAGNMEVGTRFKVINEDGGVEDEIVEIVECVDGYSHKFLAWYGDYGCPLTLADTNVNSKFVKIDSWKEVSFMEAVEEFVKGNKIKSIWDTVTSIYDGDKNFELKDVDNQIIDGNEILQAKWFVQC